ncbi:hypothetical protein Y032_0455g1767 [Ancylostoma ceylanicum]|uniref:Uncharacterized protein n=1 Tax=Ancylostoma ceylanicum TaxID=53326 RepID=A0A016WYB7_9BILA|nr:hypothetical protein Y032_0455g1767 [Ancylostoma ceylanicum]
MQRRKKPHPHYVGVKKYGKLLQEQKIRKEMAREHLRRLYNRIDEVVDVEEGRQRRATHLRQHRSKQFQSHNRTAVNITSMTKRTTTKTQIATCFYKSFQYARSSPANLSPKTDSLLHVLTIL